MMMWNEAAVPEETLEVVAEVMHDIENLKPNVIMETIKSWVPGLMTLGYRLLIAAVIIFIGFRIAKVINKMLQHSFSKMDMEVSLSKFLLSIAHTVVCGFTIFIAADQVGISTASILAILGSAGLALGLALQGSLANFAGGILILLVKPFRVGDYVMCNGNEGTVSEIGLVYTTMNTIDNKQIIMPNGVLSNSDLTNVTAQDKRQLEIKVGISYQSDLKKAKNIAQQLFESNPMIISEKPVIAFVDDLGDSAVVIGVRGWVATGNYWNAKWELTEAIKLAFDQEGIEIPFPQVSVHFDQKQEA